MDTHADPDRQWDVASSRSAGGRERLAHLAADAAGILSPWWRFRVWARLAGPSAYLSRPAGGEVARRVRPHDSLMLLRSGDWMERYAAISGRYYQDDLIVTLEQLVQPGETFVDVGSNVGFVTLTAAKLVGPAGRVVAVDANRELTARLRATLDRNGLPNVAVHTLALGAEPGSAVLVDTGHHGTGHVETGVGGPGAVRVARADDLLTGLEGPIFVKVDVEGAEQMVLDGSPDLLAKDGVRWLIEICEEQLDRFGATPEGIFATMARAGYRAFLPTLSPFSSKVRLRPLQGPLPRKIYDALFIR